jgi:DNA-directed RNA polymerase subunit omega
MDIYSLLAGFDDRQMDSRYRLVIVSAQRARYLIQGAHPQVMTRHTKETTVALEEVLSGKVEYLTGKEARQAMKEYRKQRELEAAAKPSLPPRAEDDEEIRGDLAQYVDDSTPAAAPESSEE